MAKPTGQQMVLNLTRSTGENGALREQWVRLPGLRAASDCDSPAVLYYKENPYYEDLAIIDALAVIETADATWEGGITVGLGDTADDTSAGTEIFNPVVNSAAGVFQGTVVQAVAGTGAKCIWTAKGTATDAFIVIIQNTDYDLSDMRWHLLLKVIPYSDFLGGTDLGTCPIA
jgi:hypothetical protein